MPELIYSQMKKLKAGLKSFLRKESYLVDLVLFGSALKGKARPRDIDLIAMFRSYDPEKIESVLYQLRKKGEELGLELHTEPIVVDHMFDQKVYPLLLHEGFSIRCSEFIHKKLNLQPLVLITYQLEDKNASDKVRFSYALYGRNKGEGMLSKIKGKVVGKGSILIPIAHQETIKPFFKQWNVAYKEQRVFIFG